MYSADQWFRSASTDSCGGGQRTACHRTEWSNGSALCEGRTWCKPWEKVPMEKIKNLLKKKKKERSASTA